MIPKGLTKEAVEKSRLEHGSNDLTQISPDPLWKKILHGFKDPMIMILLVALVVQVVLWCLDKAHWYEPAGVLIAILIANGVSSISESSQENKASALKAPCEEIRILSLNLEADDRRAFLDGLVALCNLMRGQRRAAARAVGDDLEALVKQSLVPDLLQRPPFGFDECIVIGNIRIVHIRPEADR